MSKRARMMDLAATLLAPEQRSEERPQPKPKIEKPKTKKVGEEMMMSGEMKAKTGE